VPAAVAELGDLQGGVAPLFVHAYKDRGGKYQGQKGVTLPRM
jgi:hypothetical protein